MTEDEAFIRAILDHPGDDTPRLVYADWLDDHSDPRAGYLRAEREAVRTGDARKLRELAAGLDPVWVARISRPPVGVCCEHVRFTDAGPRLMVSDVTALQTRLEVETGLQILFPPEYTAFLVNYNGGIVTPASPDPSGSRWPICETVEHGFFSVGHQFRRQLNFEKEWQWKGDELTPEEARRVFELAPLAWADWDHQLFIGVGGSRYGKVFYGCAGDRITSTDLSERADSLPTFLTTLTAHWHEA